jgi:hypothetical protein
MIQRVDLGHMAAAQELVEITKTRRIVRAQAAGGIRFITLPPYENFDPSIIPHRNSVPF